jgi:hypothetical protein
MRQLRAGLVADPGLAQYCLLKVQMIGHSSPGILQRYAKAIDEYRRDAVRKLEEMRAEHAPSRHAPPIFIN